MNRRALSGTVYAKGCRSAAAPTAGLQLHTWLLERLRRVGVTQKSSHCTSDWIPRACHRGRSGRLTKIHTEWCDVPTATAAATQCGPQPLRPSHRCGYDYCRGVGVSGALLLLGPLPQNRPLHRQHRSIHSPGFEFNVVDALITNFHLPKSTLLHAGWCLCGP